MNKTGIEEARKDLGEFVNLARYSGEATMITRNGEPFAVIVNVDWYRRAQAVLRGEHGNGTDAAA